MVSFPLPSKMSAFGFSAAASDRSRASAPSRLPAGKGRPPLSAFLLRRCSAAVFILAFALAGTGAFAAAYTWTGGGDGTTWESAANWGSASFPSSASDTATISSAAAITLSADVTVGALQFYTGSTVTINLNGHNLTVSGTADFGRSDLGAGQPGCNVIINGTGTFQCAELSTNGWANNSITLNNSAVLSVTTTLSAAASSAEYVTSIYGDGSSTVQYGGSIAQDSSGINEIAYYNVTVKSGSNSFSVATSGTFAAGQTVKVTVSGTFPAAIFQYEAAVSNSGDTYTIYNSDKSKSFSISASVSTATDFSNWTSDANSFVFYIEYPSTVTNGDGLNLLIYYGTAQVGSVNFTLSATNPTWLGGKSGSETDWSTAANWSTGTVPSGSQTVIIPSGTAYSPALTAAVSNSTDITVNYGAVLNLNGYNLTASSLKNLGTVKLTGTETISAACTNGTLSTVEYTGAGAGPSWGSSYNILKVDAGASLSMGTTALSVAGTSTVAGTLTLGSGVASAFAGAVTNSGTINGSTGAITLTGGISGGAFTESSTTTTVGAGFAPLTFTKNGGTVILTGTGTVGNSTNTLEFNNLTLNGSGLTFTAAGSLTVDGTLTRTAGTLAMSSYTLSLAGAAPTSGTAAAITFSSSGVLAFTGTAAQSFDPTNMTVGALTVNNSAGVTASAAVTLAGSLTLSSGALAMGTYALNVSGTIARTSGTVTSGGTITLNGTAAQTADFTGSTVYNLAVSSTAGATLSASAGTAVAGDLTVAAGAILSTGGYNLTVSGSAAVNGTLNQLSANTLTVGGSALNFGTTGALVNAGALVLNGSAAQAITPNGQSFGAVTMSGTGGVTLVGTATFASLNVSLGESFSTGGASATALTISGALVNAGSLTSLAGAAAATTMSIGASSTNSGNLYLSSTNAGGTVTLTVANGTTFANTGVLQVASSTGTVTLRSATGTFTLTGNAIDLNGKALAVSGLSTAVAHNLNVSGDALALSGTNSFTGGLTVSNAGASLDLGTSTLTASALMLSAGSCGAGAGSFTVSGALTVSGGTLSITGTPTVFSAGSLAESSGTITNTADYTLTVGGAAAIAGTFATTTSSTIKMNATATIAASVGLYNLEVASGTTTIATNALSLAGALTVDAGATLSDSSNNLGLSVTGAAVVNGAFAGGTAADSFTGAISGSGTFGASSGTSTIGGGLSGVSFTHNSGKVLLAGGTVGAYTFYNIELAGNVTAGGSWTVNNNWTYTSGTFTPSTYTVTFVPTNASSTIAGSAGFYGLACTTGGKTLVFADGTTQTVSGSLDLEGASGNLLSLTGSGTAGWTIAYSGSTKTLAFLNVNYANASSADLAAATSHNGGTNNTLAYTYNWTFSAAVCSWTGASDTDWDTATNWEYGYVPNSGDSIVIPASGVTNNLSLDGTARTALAMTVNGTLNAALATAITLTKASAAALTVGAAAVFGSPANVTWTLSGSAAAIASSLGTTIGHIVSAAGASQTVSLGNALTATDLTVSSGTFSSGTYNITLSGGISGAGSFTASSGTTTVGGDISVAGYTHNSGTLVLKGSSAQTLGAYTLYNLTLNNSSGASAGATDIGGNLVLTSGALAMGTNALSLSGAASSISQAGGSITSTGTIYFSGTGAQTADLSTSTLTGAAVNASKTGGSLSFSGGFAAGTFTVGTNKAFDLSFNTGAGQATTITSAAVFSNTGALVLGDDAADSMTFTGGLTDSSTVSGITIAGTVAATNNALTLNKALTLAADSSLSAGTGTLTLGGAVSGAYALSIGNCSAGSKTGGAVSGITGLTLNSGAVFTLGGALSVSGPLTVSSGTLTDSSYGIAVTGATAINGTIAGGSGADSFAAISGTGVLSASTGTTSISGNMTVTSFTHNSGTVEFTGGSTGAYSFYNVIINGAVSSGGAWTIGGNLTIAGGTWTAGAYTHSVAGSWTNSVGAAGFSGSSSTIDFNGSSAQTVVPNSQTFGTVTMSGSGGLALTGTATMGSLTVASTETFTLGGASATTLTINSAFDNEGITKLNSTGGALILQVASGKTVTNNGSLQVSSSTGTVTLRSVSGTFTLAGSTALSISSACTLRLSGMTTAIAHTLGANQTITLAGPATFSGGLTLNGSGAVLTIGTRTLTVGGLTVTTGTATLSSGTIAGGSSALSIGPGGAINVTGAGSITAGAFTNAGNTTWSGTGASTGSFSSVNNSGTITFSSSGTPAWTDSGDFISTGIITNTAANTIAVGGNLSISGTFSATMTNSTITMSGTAKTVNTAVQIGHLKTSGAASISALTNKLNLAGSLTLATGTSLSLGTLGADISGNAAGAGTGSLNGGSGTVTVSGSFSVPVYTATSGTTYIGGTAVTFSTLTHSGGTISLNGTGTPVALTTGAQSFNNLILTSTSAKTVNLTGALTTAGTLTLNSTVTLAAGANALSIGSTTVNAGTITLGSSTAVFTGLVTDTGTITGSSGTITFSAGLDASGGSFTASSGSTNVEGPLTFTAGSTFNHNSGTLIFTGTTTPIVFTTAAKSFYNISLSGTAQTVEASGNVTLAGSLESASGTTLDLASLNSGTNALTVAGSTNTTAGNAGTITAGSGALSFAGSFEIGSLTASSSTSAFEGSTTLHTFAANGGTVVFSGTASAPTLAANGAVFNAVSVTRTSGTLSTSNGTGSFSAASFSQSGSGGSFALAAGDTMTVSGSTTVSAGTLNLAGAYEGSGAAFTVSGGAVTALALDFITADMTVTSGSFTQTGSNTGANTLASLTVSGGACTWDSGSAGGTITISGALSNTATLSFNLKNVTIGTSISGTLEFYDLTIPAGKTLAPEASSTITVRRNMNIASTGGYATTNSPSLVLGGTNSVSGGTYTDSNTSAVNLGTVTISGSYTKTLATHMSTGALTITDTSLALSGHNLTATGAITGTGSLAASGSEAIAAGSSMTVSSFTAASSTVTFNGSSNSACGAYSFYNLIMNLGAPATTLTPSGGITVTNAFTQTEGTFVAGSYTHKIAGGWDSGANVGFDAGTSTIELTSAAPAVNSALSFYNLTLDYGGTLSQSATVSNNFVAASVGTDILKLNSYTLKVAGNVTLTSNCTLIAGTSTLELNGTGNQTVVTNAQSWYNLSIDSRSGGTLSFSGALNVTNTMTVLDGTYNVTIAGGGTAANAVSFLNTGTLAISSGYTFTGGAIDTAGPKSIAGTISVGGANNLDFSGTAVAVTATAQLGGTTGSISLGATTIAAGATLHLGDNSTASIFTVASAAGAAASGNITIQNTIADVTFTGAVSGNIGTVAINKSGGTVTFAGSLVAASLTPNSGAYNVSMTGASNAIANLVTFLQTGSLTIGDSAGDTSTFAGGVKKASGVLNFAGTIASTNTDQTWLTTTDAIVITANTVFSSGSGAISFGGPINASTADSYSLTLNSTGIVTIGGAVGAVTAFAGLTTNADGITNIKGGAVTTSGVQTYNDAVVLDADASIVSTSSTIAFNSTVTGTYTLSIQNAASTGMVSFVGAVTLKGLSPAAGAYGISMTGGCTIDNAVTFANTGALVIGDSDSDLYTFTNGLTAADTSGATLRGEIKTGGAGGQDLAFRDFAVAASGTALLETTLGKVSSTGSLTVASGCTLDLSSSQFDITALASNAGTIKLTGTQATHNFGTYTASQGTVVYYGSTAGSIFTTGMTAADGNNYYNLEIAGNAGILFSNEAALSVKNDIVIASGTLNAAYNISLGGNWTNSVDTVSWNESAFDWTFGSTSGFAANSSTVSFEKSSGSIAVTGSNRWYIFSCTSPGVTITFSNGDVQRILSGGKFSIIGSSSSYITLNRATAIADDLSTVPARTGQDGDFWFFDLLSGATLDMSYVYVYYSNARSNPISVPTNVTATPWGTYYSYKWLAYLFAMYSYTEDSDYNGRIDRIRVTTEAAVGNDFSGFTAVVSGYTVKGYSRPAAGNTFYILLEEQKYLDTGAVPSWHVTANTTLKDSATDTKYVSTMETGSSDWMIPGDTAWPVIGYTLMLPGQTQAFIQLSEPVVLTGGGTPAVGDFDSAGTGLNIVTGNTGIQEATWTTAARSAAVLAAGSSSFTLTSSMRDMGSAPVWYSSYDGLVPGAPYPTYPPETGYAAGSESSYTYGADRTDASRLAVNPFSLYRGGNANCTHRATDVLVSAPPSSSAPSGYPDYFVWPVWAKDSRSVSLTQAEIEALTASSSASSGIGLIRAFDGTQWLRDQDMTVQAKTLSALGATGLTLVYDTASSAFKNQYGLWLPAHSDANSSSSAAYFTGADGYPDDSAHSGSTVSVANTAGSSSTLWNAAIDSSNSKIVSGKTFEFFYTVAGYGSSDAPLYCARLDMTAGGDIPSNWYRLVKPFSFDIHDVRKQRGGVTVLNNVIDPTQGETVRLSYQLVSAGYVTITVFTLDGDVVSRLYAGQETAGDYTTAWNGKNGSGQSVARGMYFIRVVGPDIDEIRKVIVIRK